MIRRRKLVAIIGAVALVGGMATVAWASGSTPTTVAAVSSGLNQLCPVLASPVAGDTLTCTIVAAPVSTTTEPPVTTTTTVDPTTTTTVTTTTTIEPPVVTTTTTVTPPAFEWPTAATTGVPPGTALTNVNGDLTTTAANQVIDAKMVTGNLVINHNGVKITRSRIKGRVIDNNHTGWTLEDVDLGRDSCPSASNGGARLINADDYTLRRVHLHHNGADLINLNGGGAITILSSLLDNTCYYATDHLDSIQMYNPGGVIAFTLKDSRIDNRAVNGGALGNAAVFLSDNPGSGSRFVIDHNRLSGGGYTLQMNDATSGSNVRFSATNNVIQAGEWIYGPCNTANSVNAANASSTGVFMSGNTLTTGASVNSC